MPTYEYVCTDCKNEWEEIQKISEEPIQACPKCGKSTAKRQISGGSFILKGGGWYADLYSSTPKKAETKEGKTEAKSEAKSEGKSEGKSDAKPEKAASAPPPATTSTTPSGSGSSGSGSSKT